MHTRVYKDSRCWYTLLGLVVDSFIGYMAMGRHFDQAENLAGGVKGAV